MLKLQLPHVLTKSAARYAYNRSRDHALLKFVWDNLIGEALLLITNAARIPGADLDRYNQSLLQMMHARAVDTFQAYFADVLREVLTGNPELLSDDTTIRYGDILHAQSLQALRNAATAIAIQKKVDGVAYRGFREFEKWFANHGVAVPVSVPERARLREWVATRNVIVHNHGVVNERYLEEVTAPQFSFGQTRQIVFHDLAEMQQALAATVFACDASIQDVFQLEVRSHEDWATEFPVMALPPNEPSDEEYSDVE